MRLMPRALHLLALVGGVVIALACVLVHRIDVLRLPLGLVVGLGAMFGVVWALRTSAAPRLAASYSLGWLVGFGFVLAGRAEGDYAVAGDAAGYVMIAAAFVMVVVGVLSLGPRGSVPRART